jgi:hypothetical protein
LVDDILGALISVADPGCLSRIPDPTFFHPGSELSPSRIRIKEFKYFKPKKPKKWFLSSRKYDPGCSSWIPDPDADFLPIPDPGSRGQKATGSGSATLVLITITMFQLIVTLGMFVTTFVFGMIPLKLFSTVRENTSVTSRIR